MKMQNIVLVSVLGFVIVAVFCWPASGKIQVTTKPACVLTCSDLCLNECSMGMCYGFGPKGLAAVQPNANQSKKLQRIHQQFEKDTQAQRARIHAQMCELSSLWVSGKGTPEKVESLIDRIETDRRVIRNKAINSTFEAMNVLDVDQRTKIRNCISNGYVHLVTLGTRMNGNAAAH